LRRQIQLRGIFFIAVLAAAAWSPDGKWIASSSWDMNRERGVWGVVKIWDAATGAEVKYLEHHDKPISSICFSADGRWLAAGSWGHPTAVWATSNWEKKAVLDPPESRTYKRVLGLAFDPSGRALSVASRDAVVRVWDVETGAALLTIAYDESVYGAYFSPDGTRLATLPMDGTIRILDSLSVGQRAAQQQRTSAGGPAR
jgi:WD40 repeat protein